MKSPIQKYYDLKRNADISWFWDEGFVIKFGDVTNGWKGIRFADTWKEVEEIFEDKLKQIKMEFDQKWIDEQTKRYEKWLEDEKWFRYQTK